MSRIRCFAVILVSAALSALAGCGSPAPPAPEAGRSSPTFQDVTAISGIRFRHHNGVSGRKWMPETMGSGCALVDVDNDGWLDAVCVDGTSWPADHGEPGQARLFRNLGGGRFQDVTRQYGIPAGLFGMGVAAGDYDNDGYIDLFITALGNSRLLHNVGGKRFEDVTARVGIQTPGWPTGAAFLDYDRDGLLDLFVCHYVKWSPAGDVFFSLDGTHKSYARPGSYAGEACQLFRNVGGRFRDVSREAGIARPRTKALGVALCDFDRDGWVDLAVSNDTEPNFLFHNQGDAARGGGTFKEVAVQAGMAVAEGGIAKAGMGIDTADFQNDGREAVLITNFSGEQLSLYQRDPSGLFMDVAARVGIGTPSQRYLGFGAFFVDLDLDGWQDIVVANGHIQDDITLRSSGVAYAERALVFRGSAAGQFTDISALTGALAAPRVARGAAWGDVDNDGDADLLITTNGGAASLLRQEGPPAHHWLQLQLEGRGGNRSAIGAAVRVRTGTLVQTRMVRSGSSYLSQSSLRLLFGLGQSQRADDVEVRWPNGTVESFGALPADGALRLVQGSAGGVPPPVPGFRR